MAEEDKTSELPEVSEVDNADVLSVSDDEDFLKEFSFDDDVESDAEGQQIDQNAGMDVFENRAVLSETPMEKSDMAESTADEPASEAFFEETSAEAGPTAVEQESAEELSSAAPEVAVFSETPEIEKIDFSDILEDETALVSPAETELSSTEKEEFSAPEGVSEAPEPRSFVSWYSGSREDKQFELSKESISQVFNGDENCRIIHVNVGFDTYGWLIKFADGTIMSLRDAREYQLRNGGLPAADGVICYGELQAEFHNIEKITIYESVRYFTYT